MPKSGYRFSFFFCVCFVKSKFSLVSPLPLDRRCIVPLVRHPPQLTRWWCRSMCAHERHKSTKYPSVLSSSKCALLQSVPMSSVDSLWPKLAKLDPSGRCIGTDWPSRHHVHHWRSHRGRMRKRQHFIFYAFHRLSAKPDLQFNSLYLSRMSDSVPVRWEASLMRLSFKSFCDTSKT